MRLIAGVVLVIVMVLVGLFAIGTASDSVEDAAVANGTNASADAYNVTENITGGLAQVVSPTIVYGGVGAIVLVAAGFLVKAGASGR